MSTTSTITNKTTPAPPPMIPADLITCLAAAGLLGVHVATVYRLIKAGKLRAWRRVGGRLRVSRSEVQGLLVPVEVHERQEPPRGPTHEEAAAEAAKDRLERKWASR